MVWTIFRVEAVEEFGGEEPTEEAGDDIEQVGLPLRLIYSHSSRFILGQHNYKIWRMTVTLLNCDLHQCTYWYLTAWHLCKGENWETPKVKFNTTYSQLNQLYFNTCIFQIVDVPEEGGSQVQEEQSGAGETLKSEAAASTSPQEKPQNLEKFAKGSSLVTLLIWHLLQQNS